MGMNAVVGLKDVYFARVIKNTETEYVCEEPRKLAKSASLTLKSKNNSENFYYDDELQDTITTFAGGEFDFTGDSISNENYAMLLGADFKDGVLSYYSDQQAPEVAIQYRAKMSNGKYEFNTLYIVKFGGEDEDKYETAEDKTKVQNKTLKGTYMARQLTEANGKHKYRDKIREDELVDGNTSAKEIIANFNSKIQGQTTSTTPSSPTV